MLWSIPVGTSARSYGHLRTLTAREEGAKQERERERVRTSQTGGGTHCHSDTILWRQVIMQVGGHWQGMHRVEDGNFKLLHEGRRTCRRVGRENDLKWGIAPYIMECGSFCGVLFASFRPAHKPSVSTGCASKTYNSVAWAKPKTQLNCHEMDRG